MTNEKKAIQDLTETREYRNELEGKYFPLNKKVEKGEASALEKLKCRQLKEDLDEVNEVYQNMIDIAYQEGLLSNVDQWVIHININGNTFHKNHIYSMEDVNNIIADLKDVVNDIQVKRHVKFIGRNGKDYGSWVNVLHECVQ